VSAIICSQVSETHLINPVRAEDVQPQGLKPDRYVALTAQIKLCPFKTIYETTVRIFFATNEMMDIISLGGPARIR